MHLRVRTPFNRAAFCVFITFRSQGVTITYLSPLPHQSHILLLTTSGWRQRRLGNGRWCGVTAVLLKWQVRDSSTTATATSCGPWGRWAREKQLYPLQRATSSSSVSWPRETAMTVAATPLLRGVRPTAEDADLRGAQLTKRYAKGERLPLHRVTVQPLQTPTVVRREGGRRKRRQLLPLRPATSSSAVSRKKGAAMTRAATPTKRGVFPSVTDADRSRTRRPARESVHGNRPPAPQDAPGKPAPTAQGRVDEAGLPRTGAGQHLHPAV